MAFLIVFGMLACLFLTLLAYFIVDFERQKKDLQARLDEENAYIMEIARQLANSPLIRESAVVPAPDAKEIGKFKDQTIWDRVAIEDGTEFAYEGVQGTYLADGVNYVTLNQILYKRKEHEQSEPLPPS